MTTYTNPTDAHDGQTARVMWAAALARLLAYLRTDQTDMNEFSAIARAMSAAAAESTTESKEDIT